MSGVLRRRGRLRTTALVVLALVLPGCPERRSPSKPPLERDEVSTSRGTSTAATAAPRGAHSAQGEASIARADGAEAEAVPASTIPGLASDSPWSSREACLRFLQTRAGSANAGDAGGARIGTWNIRWYPDGRPGKKAASPGTDIPWLACTIAALDVDVLAVQEMKTLPRARARTAELLAELGRLTGGRWQAAFDDCPQPATQHVGLLWNEARVSLSRPHTEPSLNPHGSPCKDSLRPGFAADVRFADGASVRVVSVHLKSGTERRSFDLRRKSFEALTGLVTKTREGAAPAQMIFAGDFNTMGCSGCSPKIPAEEELEGVRARLAPRGLSWVATEPGCTEYYRDRGQLLDGFVVTRSIGERVGVPARAEGLCGALECRRTPRVGQAPAVRRLSDHCPVVMVLGSE